MKKIIQYIRFLPFSVALVLFGNSCVRSVDGAIEDASANRPFLPTGFTVKTVRDTANFSWTLPVLSAGKRYTYTVDISQDSTFQQIDVTKTVDTLGFTLVEPALAVGKRYYTRMRVNAFRGSQPTAYLSVEKPFTLPGQNFLRVIRDFEITSTSALVHWYANVPGLDKAVLTTDKGIVTDVAITGADNSGGLKLFNSLTPATKYTLQLFAGAKSQGILNFTTSKAMVYSTVLNSGDNLITAINNAADSAVIGLNPGTYTLGTSVFTMTGKMVTIASVSGNPNDTKINVRELNLAGNKAGLVLSGVEINGNYSGTSYGVQFLVLRGAATAGEPATFADVRLDNCIIHDFTRCLVLGNQGTVSNNHVINSFTINNCIIYNIDRAGTSTYYNISLEKTLFTNLNITKSTFYNMGGGLINMSTALAAGSAIPTVTLDFCTFNNVGGSNKNLLIDANTNAVYYTLKNSILGNSPQVSNLNNNAFRCTGAGRILDFLNNNYFKLNATYGATTPVNLTGLNQVACISADLGWAPGATTFSLNTLPSTHPVMSLSASGSTVGDPRWAY